MVPKMSMQAKSRSWLSVGMKTPMRMVLRESVAAMLDGEMIRFADVLHYSDCTLIHLIISGSAKHIAVVV